MKKILIGFSFLLVSTASRGECPDGVGDLKSFREVVREVMYALRDDNATLLSQYMQFPIKGTGNYPEDRPIKLNKEVFLKYYSEIFVTDDLGNRILFKDNIFLPRITPEERMTQLTSVSDNSHTFANGCQKVFGQAISRNPYNYVWTKENKWKIVSVDLTDYTENLYTLERKKVLEYWPKIKKSKK